MDEFDDVLKYSASLSLLYLSYNGKDAEVLRRFYPGMQVARSLDEALSVRLRRAKMRERFFDLIVIDGAIGSEDCDVIQGWKGGETLVVMVGDESDLSALMAKGIFRFVRSSLPPPILAEVFMQISREIHQMHALRKCRHAYDTFRNDCEKNRLEMEDALHQAHEQVRHKSDFLAGMSHEIRTPMNAIIGLGHLLAQEELGERSRDYVDKINTSSQLLLGIVNDILDYSKIEAGKLKIEAIEFDINTVFDHIADMVGMGVYEKGLELIFDIDHQVRPLYIGDPTRISQILLNLMSNALKFTDRGEIVLRANLLSSDESHHLLQFEVSDTGIGMNEEQSVRLFERYVQAEDSTARKFGGTGLGLSICKQLVELMGGRIWVKSEAGKGSTFGFVIKLGISRPGERRVYHLAHKELMQLRILVVDAHPHSAESLHRMLGYFHMGVDITDSLQTARELMERKGYDTVFVDEQMIGLCSRPPQPGEKRPRIVLLESRMSNVRYESCGAYGIDAHLYKPFNQQMVLNVFNTLYGEWEHPSRESESHATKAMLAEFAGSRILLAEDNTINQKVMMGLLRDTGIILEVAGDGAQALRMLEEKGPFELVLMDIHMPVMDGYEASDAIRLHYDETRLPIIALTADTAEEDVRQAGSHGMQEHLAKPIDVRLLYNLLYRYLKKGIEAELPGEPAVDEDQRYDRLLHIPAFDCAGALERAGGSKKLYVSLVEEFFELYRDAPMQLRSFNALKQYAQGLKYIHDLKGSAGNIGSVALFKMAREIEEGYRQGDARRLSELVERFEEVMEDIAGLVEQVFSPEKEREAGFGADQRRLLEALLRAARRKKVLECVETIGRLRQLRWPQSCHQKLGTVIAALKAYRFTEAVETLESMGISDASG